MMVYWQRAKRATMCCIVLLAGGCSDSTPPEPRGSFEAELQGAFELQLRGTAGFAQTDSVAPVLFQIALSKTIRDTTYAIVMDLSAGRPAQGVYSVLGGTTDHPDFRLWLIICNDPGRWCSSYPARSGLINLTASSATKISGVFNAVVENSDPNITQEFFVDGAFDAVCDRTMLRPAVALCR
jgi:hypothetical protein